jgi:tRNA pseudouridine38-40 synthase
MARPETEETARWLVQFGYDGAGFDGWARQPGRPTVEGTLVHGILGRSGGRPAPVGRALSVASRTDRGVSARANALGVRSDLPGPALLRYLNGLSPAIFFTAARAIPDGFQVRRAVRRVYRYWNAGDAEQLEAWVAAASLFREAIDVRSFGRGVAADAPRWVTVEGVTVRPLEGGIEVEVRAPYFVWGMVRKIVGALREHGAGRLPLEELRSAVTGRRRLTLPLAEPEGLLLWEVEYPEPWTYRWTGPNRRQAALDRRLRAALWAREKLLSALPTGAGVREGAGAAPLRVPRRRVP